MIIDASNGDVVTTVGILAARLEEFQKSPLGIKSKLMVDNPPYHTYQLRADVSSGGTEYPVGMVVVYKDGMRQRASIGVAIGSSSWRDWTWEVERAQAKVLRDLLELELGRLPQSFPWGKVEYVEDRARQSCDVTISYSRC